MQMIATEDLYAVPREIGFDEEEPLAEPRAAVFRVWERQIISAGFFMDEGAAHAYAREMSTSFPAPYRFLVTKPGGAVLERYQNGRPFRN